MERIVKIAFPFNVPTTAGVVSCSEGGSLVQCATHTETATMIGLFASDIFESRGICRCCVTILMQLSLD